MKISIPPYQSDADTSVEASIVVTERKSKATIAWKTLKECCDLKEALDFMALSGNWAKHYSNDGVKYGRKVRYRCKNIARRSSQCRAAMQLVYPPDTETILVQGGDEEHNCQEVAAPSKSRLTAVNKATIKTMWKDGKQPHQIWDLYGREALSNKRQLYNCINNLKQKDNPIVTIDDLHEWCLRNEGEPEEKHMPFVVQKQLNCDSRLVRVFISTPHLMKEVAKSGHLHADGTYKLMWEGFPLLVVGTSDAARKFIVAGVAITSGETHEDYEFLFGALATYYRTKQMDYEFK